MVVLLVLVTFLVFIIIDAVMSRKHEPLVRVAPALADMAAGAEVVSGFQVPGGLRYHPGHTWLARERKNVFRMGADAFAATLLAGVTKIELPKPGTWVRQGQKAVTLFAGKDKLELVSPVEGEVTEINAEVAANPALLAQEPYGAAWFVRVFAPDEEGLTRNLLPSDLVRGWMQRAADRFYALQPQLAGATAAEGGEPVKGAAAAQSLSWKQLGEEFFLS